MNKWWIAAVVVLTLLTAAFSFRQIFGRASASCRTLAKVCEEAGFKRGEEADNRIFREQCMIPILRTGAFNGQTLDAKVVAACRSQLEKKKARAR